MNEMVEKNNFEVMKDLQGYFKEGERRAIYTAAKTFRDKALIRLLWVTGRRINEILNIKVSEIDFQLKAITIHVEKKTKKIKDEHGNKIKTKYDKLSLSYLDEGSTKLIKAYITNSNLKSTDYLFNSEFNKNKPISRQRAFQIVRKLAEEVGINNVGGKQPHPHHFRHTYAIDQARNMKSPADVRKLQMTMDHSSLAVTEQYLKFSDEEIKTLVENVRD